MDPVKILKRAWHILWSYRALWVFGLILALTAAGSSGGNGNSGTRYQGDGGNQGFEMPLPGEVREGFEQAGKEIERVFDEGISALGISQGEINTLIWIGVAFVVLMIVIGIAMAIARYVSETAVIRMVDEYEATDTKKTVREGFRIGWSRTSWRLFLINLIVHIPAFLLLTVLLIAGIVIYNMVEGGGESFAAAGIVGLIGVVFLVIFVVVIASIILNLLREFFWRVCALEDVGVRESLVRGWQLVREEWKNVGLMWLIMIGLGIAWMIVSFISFFLLLPVALFTTIIAAVVVAIPGLLLAGLFGMFLSGYLPWIAAGVFVLPLFFTMAFSPWVLLTAWQQVYKSTVWTLTYRELKVLPSTLPETAEGPVGD